ETYLRLGLLDLVAGARAWPGAVGGDGLVVQTLQACRPAHGLWRSSCSSRRRRLGMVWMAPAGARDRDQFLVAERARGSAGLCVLSRRAALSERADAACRCRCRDTGAV